MNIIKNLQYMLAKRACEKELARTAELMEGHKSAGIPAGHEYYGALATRAYEAIAILQAQAVQFSMPVPSTQSIALDVPMLKTLEDMRDGTAKQGVSPAAIAVLVFLGGGALSTAMAIYYDWYLLLTHFAVAHLGR